MNAESVFVKSRFGPHPRPFSLREKGETHVTPVFSLAL
jgi:hypothetical protein